MAADGSALDDLRARVVAAGGPANASMTFAKEWLAFNDAPEPAFIRGAGGKLAFSAAADASKKAAYACFFTPKVDPTTGRMMLQCDLSGCKLTKPISYEVADKDGVSSFPFTNAFNHLVACSAARSPILRAGDVKDAKDASAGGGAPAKRACSTPRSSRPSRRTPLRSKSTACST